MGLRRVSRPVRGAVPMLALAVVASAVLPTVSSGEPLLGTEPQVRWHSEHNGEFGFQRVGTPSEPRTLSIVNRDVVPLEIRDVRLEVSPYRYELSAEEGVEGFRGTSDCPGTVLLVGAACRVEITFAPLRAGTHVATVRVDHSGLSGTFAVEVRGAGTMGLYVAGALGEVVGLGDAKSHGDLRHVALDSPVFGMATTASGEGYWLVQASGRVWPFGDAADFGSAELESDRAVVGIAATPSGEGYWLLGDDGSVYTFGDAPFFGSASGTLPADAWAVAIAPTPSGTGYWVADDTGGVWPFGEAGYFGAPDELPPRYPIAGFAPTVTGEGYWVVDLAGGVFSYGDAVPFAADSSSSGSGVGGDPVITLEATPTGKGLWVASTSGNVTARGDATVGAANLYWGYGPVYSEDGEIQRTFAVDMASNLRPFTPDDSGGMIEAKGNGGIRAARLTCLPDCAGAPPVPAPVQP